MRKTVFWLKFIELKKAYGKTFSKIGRVRKNFPHGRNSTAEYTITKK